MRFGQNCKWPCALTERGNAHALWTKLETAVSLVLAKAVDVTTFYSRNPQLFGWRMKIHNCQLSHSAETSNRQVLKDVCVD